jgi:hypothetical protein
MVIHINILNKIFLYYKIFLYNIMKYTKHRRNTKYCLSKKYRRKNKNKNSRKINKKITRKAIKKNRFRGGGWEAWESAKKDAEQAQKDAGQARLAAMQAEKTLAWAKQNEKEKQKIARDLRSELEDVEEDASQVDIVSEEWFKKNDDERKKEWELGTPLDIREMLANEAAVEAATFTETMRHEANIKNQNVLKAEKNALAAEEAARDLFQTTKRDIDEYHKKHESMIRKQKEEVDKHRGKPTYNPQFDGAPTHKNKMSSHKEWLKTLNRA